QQVGGWTERIPLPRGVRFIHEVEAEQLGIADEGLDGIDEGRVGAIAETQPDQSLDPARERIERADTTQVREIEPSPGGRIAAARIEVVIRGVVEAGGRRAAAAGQGRRGGRRNGGGRRASLVPAESAYPGVTTDVGLVLPDRDALSPAAPEH